MTAFANAPTRTVAEGTVLYGLIDRMFALQANRVEILPGLVAAHGLVPHYSGGRLTETRIESGTAVDPVEAMAQWFADETEGFLFRLSCPEVFEAVAQPEGGLVKFAVRFRRNGGDPRLGVARFPWA